MPLVKGLPGLPPELQIKLLAVAASMVSTRSGNVIGARRTGKEAASAEAQKQTPKNSSGKLFGTPNSLTTVSRIASQSLAATSRETFLESPGVRTRSEGPVPEISLSTEPPYSLPKPTAEPRTSRKSGSRARSAQAVLEQTADEAQVLRGGNTDAAAEFVSNKGEEGASGRESEIESEAAPVDVSDSDTEAARSEGNDTTPATSGPTPEQQAVDERLEDSQDESGSDEDALGGLAASMWSALRNQRLGGVPELGPSKDRTKDQVDKTRMKKPSSDEAAGLGEGIEWCPETKLPGPLRSAKTEAQAKAAAQETGLSKPLLAPPRDAKLERKARKAAREQQSEWHELPVTPITDEVKRDLRLLRLRGAMDTKRFYKKAEKGRFSTRFAIGTVVEGPTDFYSGRLTKKQRKQTITEELLADHDMRASQKRRFDKLQEEKSRWSHKKHKGSGERSKKRAKRPKH